MKNEKEARPEIKTARLVLPKTRFAPIYDSGCSFGRELEDKRVLEMLNNDEKIQHYISKGLAEIHWKNEKVSHFELIEKIFQIKEYKQFVLNSLQKLISKFNIEKVESIVFKIDNELINLGNPSILPQERKELIIKLLTLRFEKLEKMFSQMR